MTDKVILFYDLKADLQDENDVLMIETEGFLPILEERGWFDRVGPA